MTVLYANDINIYACGFLFEKVHFNYKSNMFFYVLIFRLISYKCLKKDEKFVVHDPVDLKTLEGCKNLLMNEPILAYPDFIATILNLNEANYKR